MKWVLYLALSTHRDLGTFLNAEMKQCHVFCSMGGDNHDELITGRLPCQ